MSYNCVYTNFSCFFFNYAWVSGGNNMLIHIKISLYEVEVYLFIYFGHVESI